MAHCRDDPAVMELFRAMTTMDTELYNLRLTIVNSAQEKQYYVVFAKFEELRASLNNLLDEHHIKINYMEQKQFENQIEILGLPEGYAEDMDGVLNVLSDLLHIAIYSMDIKSFQRIGELRVMGSVFEGNFPRPLIIELFNNNMKKRILTVAKYRVLTVPGSNVPMYMHDRLTDRNKQLLMQARQEAHRHEVDYVWVEDGKILVRKDDFSSVHEIRCESDIDRMAHY